MFMNKIVKENYFGLKIYCKRINFANWCILKCYGFLIYKAICIPDTCNTIKFMNNLLLNFCVGMQTLIQLLEQRF